MCCVTAANNTDIKIFHKSSFRFCFEPVDFTAYHLGPGFELIKQHV
jgi:hypothetical protein